MSKLDQKMFEIRCLFIKNDIKFNHDDRSKLYLARIIHKNFPNFKYPMYPVNADYIIKKFHEDYCLPIVVNPKSDIPLPRKKGFYESDEWRALRYQALKVYGRKCSVCGATPESGKIMHVDHIKPRSRFPELALLLENLQVLCEDCNIGKSNKDTIKWRK